MRVLLDTHAFLWWALDDSRLSERAREIIGEGENDVLFSVASGWEIAIKSRLGRLRVPDDFERFMTDQLQLNDFRVLPVELAHALHVRSLPDHHRDPFDRMLVAQSRIEGLPIVGRDKRLEPYGVELLW